MYLWLPIFFSYAYLKHGLQKIPRVVGATWSTVATPLEYHQSKENYVNHSKSSIWLIFIPVGGSPLNLLHFPIEFLGGGFKYCIFTPTYLPRWSYLTCVYFSNGLVELPTCYNIYQPESFVFFVVSWWLMPQNYWFTKFPRYFFLKQIWESVTCAIEIDSKEIQRY